MSIFFNLLLLPLVKKSQKLLKQVLCYIKYNPNNPNNFDDNSTLINDRTTIDSVVTSDKILTINPYTENDNTKLKFSNESRYNIKLIGVNDTDGFPLADVSWDFSTRTILRAIIQPTENEIVSRSTNITVSFSEAMDESSLGDGLKLEELDSNSNLVIAIVPKLDLVYDSTTNTDVYKLNSILLKPSTKYKASLMSQILDENGVGLASNTNFSRTFTTNTISTSTLLSTQVSNVIAVPRNNSIELSWNAAPALPNITQIMRYNVYISSDD